MSEKIEINKFKGMKNNEADKVVEFEYFQNIVNFAIQDNSLNGLEKLLCPELIQKIGEEAIDGIFEYRFLDSNNILRNEIIVVSGGTIYKTDFVEYKVLKTGLTPGRCSFAVYNDKLFITNGKDNIWVYYGEYGTFSQMGAPADKAQKKMGNLYGTYRYTMTYITNGGEEVIGSFSNQIEVAYNKITLYLPLGYAGTIKRKIYRNFGNNNDTFKLVATINDNTTTEFEDNVKDESLTDELPDINNELPKPYFLSATGGKLFGGKNDKYPTQVYVTDIAYGVFDLASYIDVSNFGDDNSPVTALSQDFNKIVIGTEKNIYFCDPATNSVSLTKANVGILDGYAVARCVAFGEFAGGLIFASSKYDIRLITEQQFQTINISTGNITTNILSQNIQEEISTKLKGYGTISAIFFDYKFMLQIDEIRYIFDIRNMGWFKQLIETENFISEPVCLAEINGQLFNGQKNGCIEKEYQSLKYYKQDCVGYLETGKLSLNSQYRLIEKIYLWLSMTENNKYEIQVSSDIDPDFKDIKEFTLLDGSFDSGDFSNTDFSENINGFDYRIYNIYKPCRWFKFRFVVKEGSVIFQSFEISLQQLSNKE